jgi:hypothetical protein
VASSKEIHKYTWSSRGSESLIDYVIVKRKLASQVRDTTVFRGSNVNSDHYVVISKIAMLARWKRKKNTYRAAILKKYIKYTCYMIKVFNICTNKNGTIYKSNCNR